MVYICVHILYICICVYVYLYVQVYVYVYTYMHVYILYIHTHLRIHAYTYIYIHTHTYTHIYICIHTDIYISFRFPERDIFKSAQIVNGEWCSTLTKALIWLIFHEGNLPTILWTTTSSNNCILPKKLHLVMICKIYHWNSWIYRGPTRNLVYLPLGISLNSLKNDLYKWIGGEMV